MSMAATVIFWTADLRITASTRIGALSPSSWQIPAPNLAGFGAMYPSWRQIDIAMANFRGPEIGEMCELLHTRTPGIASHYVFSCCLRGDGMNNLSQPPQPTE